jgi:stress-induced morphogen
VKYLSKVYNRNWLTSNYLALPPLVDICKDNGEILMVDEDPYQDVGKITPTRCNDNIAYKQFHMRMGSGRAEQRMHQKIICEFQLRANGGGLIHMEWENYSEKHKDELHPEHAKTGETHFKLTIVSDAFEGVRLP